MARKLPSSLPPSLLPSLPPPAAWDVLQKLCGLLARAAQPPAMFVSLKSSHLGMLRVLKIASKWQLPFYDTAVVTAGCLNDRAALLSPQCGSILMALRLHCDWVTARWFNQRVSQSVSQSVHPHPPPPPPPPPSPPTACSSMSAAVFLSLWTLQTRV